MSGYGKNAKWLAVTYPENMVDGWQYNLERLLQLPYAYCVHDKGLQLESGDDRKVHVHWLLVFAGPTTYKHACEVFNRLSAPGKKCFSAIEPCYDVRMAYEYLIHNTKDSIQKGKYQFPPAERIEGNNFDIGAYEQVSIVDKNRAFDDITSLVLDNTVTNMADLVTIVYHAHGDEFELYRDVLRAWSGHFDRLTRGVYLKEKAIAEARAEARKEAEKHAC